MPDPNCIFCSIVAGDVPCTKVYEDDVVLAFNDINPIARVHVLVVPKAHFDKLHESDESHREMLGQIMIAAGRVAEITGLVEPGYRLRCAQGKGAGQDVFHLHIHVIGGGAKSR